MPLSRRFYRIFHIQFECLFKELNFFIIQVNFNPENNLLEAID